MKTLEFIFDIASPNAYLVCKVLPELIERTGAAVDGPPCVRQLSCDAAAADACAT